MEEVTKIASRVKQGLLPTKSKQLYEEAYSCYRQWCLKRNIKKTTEDTILAYFDTKLAPYKASPLWTKYSMLRTTIKVNEKVDISKFGSILCFLKRKGEGYKPKKSLILGKEHVETFLMNAGEELLLNKVIIIFGVAGACRCQELVSLTTKDVEDHEKHFLVKLVDAKNRKDRSFVILPSEKLNSLELIRKYIQLQSKTTSHNRFFIYYAKGKCTVQPVGIHKIGSVPSFVAKFLKLPDSNSYTGHCMRRSSASLLANSGGSMSDLLRHGGWSSMSIAEGYVEHSVTKKIDTAAKILGQENYSTVVNGGTENLRQSDVPMSISDNVNCVININYNINSS